jgi:hypothetical protein
MGDSTVLISLDKTVEEQAAIHGEFSPRLAFAGPTGTRYDTPPP